MRTHSGINVGAQDFCLRFWSDRSAAFDFAAYFKDTGSDRAKILEYNFNRQEDRKSKRTRHENSRFIYVIQLAKEEYGVHERDVCDRRHLMNAKREFSVRCEEQLSGSGP